MENSTQYPFGKPDGARSNIEEMLDDFIEFDIARYGPGIAVKPSDLSTRVIVGAKGSGKTVYLRRTIESAKNNQNVYATNWEYDPPKTIDVLTFTNRFTENLVVEMWMELWYCSILSSLSTHVLFNSVLRNQLDVSAVDEISDLLSDFLPYRTPVSTYKIASFFIDYHHSSIELRRLFNHPRWPQIEYWIANQISRLPPVYFFLDSIDEYYEDAPIQWMQAQLGLFYKIMQMFRDSRIGGRLHIIITVRDQVLSAVFRGEHQTRYRGEPHIKILDWNKESIEHLLTRKIEKLDHSVLLAPHKPHATPIQRWLGMESIRNDGRKSTEHLIQYITRHTRYSPRDIIILGNRLSKQTLFCKANDLDLTEDMIRKIVSEEAKVFGNEQIEICATQIASSTMPKTAITKEYDSYYIGPKSIYGEKVADILRSIIQSIGKDRFDWTTLLENTMRVLNETDYEPEHIFAALWQNRLIGYRNENNALGNERFCTSDFLDEFKLPTEREEYVFHPILIDSLGIRAIGSIPPSAG